MMAAQLKIGISAFIGRWFLKAVFALNRQTVLNNHRWDEVLTMGRPVLICCWHGRLLFPVFRWRREGSHALAGLHDDAEIISRIGTKLGWSMLRGSSSRGGRRAYRQLLDALKGGGKVFITPDGPRGPEYEVKEGSVKSAERTNAILLPVSGQSSRRWEIRNWDTFVVPKPFGRVVNALGEPIDPEAISETKELEEMLRNAMNEAQKEADAWINREI